MTTYLVIAMLIGLCQCIVQHASKKSSPPYYPNLISYMLFYDESSDK